MIVHKANLEDIQERLDGRQAVVAQPGALRPAAVALLIREGNEGLEILYILRAQWDQDPWSGNIGFPGGRIESSDATAKAAAERETREEVGIDLSMARYLGRLDDLVGMTQPVVVSCFVYAVQADTALASSTEVAEAFWVSLGCLIDKERHCREEVIFGGKRYDKPGIIIHPSGKPALWGLTYRLTMQLLILLGYEAPADLDQDE